MTEASQKPCTNCRRRKVRCDKQTPCGNCGRSNTRCIYDEQSEGEGFAPLVLDKPTTIHLFDRLSGLEQMVSKLSSVHPQMNGFVPEAKDALVQPTSSTASILEDVDMFPFTAGQNGTAPSNTPFPSLQESHMLIQFFIEVTEPFIKLIHIPFFQKQLADYRAGEGESPVSFEATLHCIHVLTLSTLSSSFVLDFFRRPRDTLLVDLRKSAEEALIKADFLRTRQPNVLRALLYFINFLFEMNDIEYASSLLGVAHRLSLHISLHHDLPHTSPFVRDLRRRLWHYLIHLNSRAGTLLSLSPIFPTEWSTPPPTHASDNQWEPFRSASETFTGSPAPVVGYADTSFILARAEIEALNTLLRGSEMSFPAMESYIATQRTEILQKYLSNISPHPLQRFISSLLTIHLSALSLSARHLHHKTATPSFRADTFLAAIILLESISAVESDLDFLQFAWVLRAFVPVQAIVTVLTCTLFDSKPDCEERAWREIDRMYKRYNSVDCRLVGEEVFEPINALRERALEVRRQREMEM